MPQINEILDNRAKKFIKRSYRPWDLSGNLDENPKNIEQEKESLVSTDGKLTTNRTQDKRDKQNDGIKESLSFSSERISTVDVASNSFHKLKNQTQIKHKQDANRAQTEHKSHSSLTPQTNTSSVNFKATHNLDAKEGKYEVKKKIQTAHKLETNISFASLSGIQRDIIVLIFNHCKLAKQDVTNEMAISYISLSLNIRIGSVKTSIFRLEEKNFITRVEYKVGRGGWSRYKISDALYSELLYLDKTHKLDTNYTQIEHKLTAELTTKQNTNSLSDSSFNNTTTTNEKQKKELPQEWLDIDIEPLEMIRFYRGHIEQLFRHGLDISQVEESIYHYAFDLTENNRAKDIKTDPLSYFMGIMKRSGYYVAPDNYESPQEKGKRLRLEQEAKKAQKLLEAENAAMNAYYEIWVNKLSSDEKHNLVGKDEMTGNGILMQTDKLKKYYKDKIWPDHYKRI